MQKMVNYKYNIIIKSHTDLHVHRQVNTHTCKPSTVILAVETCTVLETSIV